MRQDITIVTVEPSPIAAVRVSTTFSLWPTQFMQPLGVVYDAVRSGKVRQNGQNVMVYHPRGGDSVEIECGVEVAEKFDAIGDVVYRETPGGTAATLVHVGPYDQLRASHQALIDWSRKNGHRLAGVSWEIYGDWNDDPAKLHTEIFHLLELS
jgi:effector-binding domain-containing protein